MSLPRERSSGYPGSASAGWGLSRFAVAHQRVLRLLALTAVLLLAAGLRGAYLDALGYNSDEAVYAGQAAAIAKDPVLSEIFPVFRAHPLLFQFTLSLFYSVFGTSDLLGRAVSAAVGVATVFLVYCLGVSLYGRRAGLYAALFMALMPYHVIVTRQVLLDGPMVFCSTLSLLFMVRFAQTRRAEWLYAAAAGMGLMFLAKETSILMVGAVYAFLALSPKITVRIIDIFLSMVVMVAVMAAFPLSVSLAGGGGGGKTQQYLVWQLFRRPNHTWDFYPTVVPPAIGVLVIAAALLGLLLLRRQSGWPEKLLGLWILVPVVFFELWPTKGFQYLLPAAPPLVLLAARTLVRLPERDLRLRWPRHSLYFRVWRVPQFLPGLLGALLIASSLFLSSWSWVHPAPSADFIAGSGGIPGGREAGVWIDANIPQGATFVAIGPSMANILKFYGHRRTLGLSVSPNPLHRNPSYEPVLNLDYQIRSGEVQYLVWDSFSAGRSDFFSATLLRYVNKYYGRVVHMQTIPVTTPDGAAVEKPIIIVYEVRP